MPNPEDSLSRECAALTAYLTRLTPDEYILAKYREGHRTIPYLNGGYFNAKGYPCSKEEGKFLSFFGQNFEIRVSNLFVPGAAK